MLYAAKRCAPFMKCTEVLMAQMKAYNIAMKNLTLNLNEIPVQNSFQKADVADDLPTHFIHFIGTP